MISQNDLSDLFSTGRTDPLQNFFIVFLHLMAAAVAIGSPGVRSLGVPSGNGKKFYRPVG